MERIQNAYLIICPSAAEASAYLNDFLLRLMCEGKTGCGECPACRRVSSGTHTDILYLHKKSASGQIPVEESRLVPSFIAQRAYEGGYKAVVIEDAQALSSGAANALLKSIEEPPKNTVFLLTAPSAGSVLTTVASRCETVILRPETMEECEREVTRRTGADSERARLCARLAGGFPRYAAQLSADGEYLELRRGTIAVCERLLSVRGYIYSKSMEFLIDNAPQIDCALGVMAGYFADLGIVAATGGAEGIVNVDAQNAMLSQKCFTTGQISIIIDCIEQARRDIGAGGNMKLALERMFINILEAKFG